MQKITLRRRIWNDANSSMCFLNWQVLLDKLALDKEKHTLLQENQQLRAILKQYLDGKYINIADPSF